MSTIQSESVVGTPRLDLRELKFGDAEFILELLNEAGFIRFIGDKGVRTLSDARDYIQHGPMDSYARNGFGLYAACLRDGTPIGICGLVKREGLDDPDVGFAFLSRYGLRGMPWNPRPRFSPMPGTRCTSSAWSRSLLPITGPQSPS